MSTSLPTEPPWLQDARTALDAESKTRLERAARKEAGIIARAAKRRGPLGRFLRTKAGQRLSYGKRVPRHVSVPVDLDMHFVAEAADVGLSMSRFLIVLAALGAAQWPFYRGLLYEGNSGEAPIPLPKLVEHILTNAANPETPLLKPTTQPHVSAWQRATHEALLAQAKAKARKAKSANATDAVLRGAGVK